MDLETVERITKLARIELKHEEKLALVQDLNRILEFVSHLDEVDTQHVEPLVSVAVDHMPMRQDKVTDGNLQEAVMANAPQHLNHMFAVPKMVE